MFYYYVRIICLAPQVVLKFKQKMDYILLMNLYTKFRKCLGNINMHECFSRQLETKH